MREAPQSVDVVEHPQYRKIFVKGVFGGMRDGYFELELTSINSDFTPALSMEPIDFDKMRIRRILEAKLILDPMEMKALSIFLTDQVKQYEVVFGQIPSPQEVADRFKRHQREGAGKA